MFSYPHNDRNRAAERETYEQILSFAQSVYGAYVIECCDENYIFVNRGGTACNVYILADFGELWFKEIDYFCTSESWGLGNSWDFQERCDQWYKEHTQRCPHCGSDSVDFERGVCNDCDAITFCPHCQADLQVDYLATCDNDGLLDAEFQENDRSLKLGCCGETIWIDSKSNFLIDGDKYPLVYIKQWQELADVSEVAPSIGEFCEGLENKED